jgi:uncharacterized protein
MSLLPLPVSREAIDVAVARLAEQFRPRRVGLFGSYAAGRPTPDSDVDLLVIMDTALRPVEQAAVIRGGFRFPFPTDLLVRTPAQVEERVRLGDPFIREAFAGGIVLYEATHARVD